MSQGHSYIVTLDVKHGYGLLLSDSLTMRLYRKGQTPVPELVSVSAVKKLASMGVAIEQISVDRVDVIEGGEKE